MVERPAQPSQQPGDRLELSVHKTAQGPTVQRLTDDELLGRAQKVLPRRPPRFLAPILELTARQPYDATNGNMDVYHPGRWDTSSNLVYMNPIVSTGPNPGEWDGTVIYVSCGTSSSTGYLVAVHFSGYQTTMHLHGPWGDNTAYTATTSDTGAVFGFAPGTDGLSFTVNCTAPILGYLESILVYPG